jgi:hypothetical protein
MLQELQEMVPAFHAVEDAKVVDSQGNIFGWSVSLVDAERRPLGGGCHADRDVARRIATAEAIERSFVSRLFHDTQERQRFLLDEYPTTCGFAAGFEQDKVRFRAVAEGCERWIWEQWIDHHYRLPEVSVSPAQLSPLARFFYESFEGVQFFWRPFEIQGAPEGVAACLQIGIVIGHKKGGVFAGSRVTGLRDDFWTHALVECWRHARMFDMTPDTGRDDLFMQRVRHFGRDGTRALRQVEAAHLESWPDPRLRLMVDAEVTGKTYYLCRALCESFGGWHLGGAERFVY